MGRGSDPRTDAADPRASTWVSANAGSGKTSTLVRRVARLLLAGSAPERILCVTYTKAAAAEMQRRVFRRLGEWAVMADEALAGELELIDEGGRDLSQARRLFARALETPGGLKIETIHAFCEKLLRRFPLEAGISPGFTVLDEAEAARIAAAAREQLARAAVDRPGHALAAAYAHFAIELPWEAFNALFAALAARRRRLAEFVDRGGASRVWERCGFAGPVDPESIGAEAVRTIRWRRWEWAADRLADAGSRSGAGLALAMRSLHAGSPFEDLAAIFFTTDGAGEPRRNLGVGNLDPAAKTWLAEVQAKVGEARGRMRAARIARDTRHVLVLATGFGELYEGAKSQRSGLDFDDLIEHSRALLTEKADAAWVLYKLDGGIDHLLLDEAQDTSPEQWEIVRALAGEFFGDKGAGARDRTVFAVADEKQSIFSFQGAAPERFALEQAYHRDLVRRGGKDFKIIPLPENFRSAREILEFVDQVFTDPRAAAGLRAAGSNVAPLRITHTPVRPAGGCVELWPRETSEEAAEVDIWAPVDAEPPEGKNKKLARRIARSIRAMVARGEAVFEPDERPRPCAWRDFLILVRRRGTLFDEIIRALKAQGVPAGGADRLMLSEHGVFADLMALARFVLFPTDDLSLAELLRGPFCDVSEDSLFDLAHERGGALWTALRRRAGERPEWGAAAEFLTWARAGAGTLAPFDFYGAVLARLDGAGRSMRARQLTPQGAA
ncbi:MAG: UvrD-helicase domain-containing protein, partial [Caulobacteraceae bacterium]